MEMNKAFQLVFFCAMLMFASCATVRTDSSERDITYHNRANIVNYGAEHAEIIGPVFQLSSAHSHFARSITWSSVASGSRETNHGCKHAQGRYGCHACRPLNLGGAPRLRGHRRHRHTIVYFIIQL